MGQCGARRYEHDVTEDWSIFLSVSAEFLPDENADSPFVADDQVLKGFAAITYVF